MRPFRLVSRSGVPTAPRKYFVVTMVEALADQLVGNSTPDCSKIVSPVFQLVCSTSRRSWDDSVPHQGFGAEGVSLLAGSPFLIAAYPHGYAVVAKHPILNFLGG